MKKFLIALSCLACAFSHAEIVFQIGKPDASGAEFKSFRGLDDTRFRYMNGYDEEFRAYRNLDKSLEFFANPVVYKVGESKDSDWSFIQPFANCVWANIANEPKTFSIEFNSPKDKRDFYFMLGWADASNPWVAVEIRLNGQKIHTQSGFYIDKETKKPDGMPSSLINHPDGKGMPSNPLIVKIPYSSFKKDGAKNIIEIVPIVDKKNRLEIWAIYDFVKLSTDERYPKIEDPRPAIIADAIKAMGTEEVVFATKGEGRDYHWYANYGKLVHAKTGNPNTEMCFNAEVFSRMGGKLVVYNLKTGKYRYLIDDPKGCVRDPQVSYDGKKILFSYRKGESDLFHLYEIDADGKNLKMLPIAGDWNDIEPCYMPNGDILYTSDRLNKTVQCWMVPVSNLHRWFKAENKIRAISVNPDVDNRPRILRDGRISYMRWDYNHRSQVSYHHLWTINPDGSNDMIYLGNDKPGGLFIGAEQLPEEEGVVFTCAPGHGIKDHRGDIAHAIPPFDPSDPYAFTYLNGRDRLNHALFDPFPLKGRMTLATTLNNKMLIFTKDGMYAEIDIPQEIMASDAEVYMNLPPKKGNKDRHIPKCKVIARNLQPLAPREVPQSRPEIADFSQKTAKVFLQDIYQGRKMADVKRGTVKKLLITQVLPEPVHYHGGYYPLNYNGGFVLEKIWGTVPVYEDGSANFEVPASIGLAFTALDENNRAVKRMQSFVGFAPGTSMSCVGCHENRTEAPVRKKELPLAYRKGTSKIEKIEGVPPIVDYMRHVQPILDKYCIECHNPRNYKGGVILTKGLAPQRLHSLLSLTSRNQIISGSNKWGNMSPYTFGSGGSELMNKLDTAHHGKKIDEKDMNVMRAWLDTGSFQIGSYSAVGTGFIFDSFFETGFNALSGEEEKPAIDACNQVISGICGKCHWMPKQKKLGLTHVPWVDMNAPIQVREGEEGVKTSKLRKGHLFNYFSPDESIALIVPLAKSAGGLAEDGGKAHPIVFKDKNDKEYIKLRDNFKKITDFLKKNRPFANDPSFRPSYGYVMMMKKCGILSEDFPEDKPIDAMEIDEKYFKWQMDNLERRVSKEKNDK